MGASTAPKSVIAAGCGTDRVVVLLGDNVFERPLAPYIRNFEKQARGARVLVKEVHDPQRYGVAELSGRNIAGIEEKPKSPKSNLAVVGGYFYDSQVWEIIDAVKPSARGEYEITSVNNAYIDRKQLEFDVVQGQWTDAGTFDSLAEANRIMGSSWKPSGAEVAA